MDCHIEEKGKKLMTTSSSNRSVSPKLLLSKKTMKNKMSNQIARAPWLDSIEEKRENGVYYTINNPFKLSPFKKWAKKSKITESRILEPFAGANNIIIMLTQVDLCNKFCSYDIDPKDKRVVKKNTLDDFPNGYKTCITNPPWLTSYFARRNGVYFPETKYDNLYKMSLELALKNCDNVAFIIPATFLRTKLFRDRLSALIFINKKIFVDTDHPVCIALFNKKIVNDTDVYYDNKHIGKLSKLERYMPNSTNERKIKFNDPNGEIGLYAIDNTKEASIRFCKGNEIKRRVIHSDRLITRISVDYDVGIEVLNQRLNTIREKTHDVFFAPFKGLRKDGQYRRRIDYEFVRNLINACS